MYTWWHNSAHITASKNEERFFFLPQSINQTFQYVKEYALAFGEHLFIGNIEDDKKII